MEIKNIRRICVFCGSSSQVNTQLFVEVKRLGAWLAQHGIELIYGAGNVGLMGALADSVLAAGSVLAKDFYDEYVLYGGVPAKPIKNLPHDAAYFIRKKGFVV